MTLEELMNLFVGKTVKSFIAPSLNIDGSGPKNLIIRFTDDTMISAVVDNFRLVNELSVNEWTQGEALRAKLEVMKHMR
jgi:hypothetical protein